MSRIKDLMAVRALLDLYENHRNFFWYSVIGISGVALDYITFLILFNAVGLDKNVANVISTSLGITNNFFWNAFLNFKKTDKLLVRFFTFYAVGIVGLLLTSLMFVLFVDLLKIDANLVKACSIVVVVIVQYGLNRKFSFN